MKGEKSRIVVEEYDRKRETEKEEEEEVKKNPAEKQSTHIYTNQCTLEHTELITG